MASWLLLFSTSLLDADLGQLVCPLPAALAASTEEKKESARDTPRKKSSLRVAGAPPVDEAALKEADEMIMTLGESKNDVMDKDVHARRIQRFLMNKFLKSCEPASRQRLAEVRIHLGAAAKSKGDLTAQKRHLKTAVQLCGFRKDRSAKSLHTELATCCNSLGCKKDAQAHCRIALELAPRDEFRWCLASNN
jgi:hypothetical protein